MSRQGKKTKASQSPNDVVIMTMGDIFERNAGQTPLKKAFSGVPAKQGNAVEDTATNERQQALEKNKEPMHRVPRVGSNTVPSSAVEALAETAIRFFWSSSDKDSSPKIVAMTVNAKDRAELNKKELSVLGYQTRGGHDLIEYTQKLNVFNGVLRKEPEVSKQICEAFGYTNSTLYRLGGHDQDTIDNDNRNEIVSTTSCIHEMQLAIRQGEQGLFEPKDAHVVTKLHEFVEAVRDIGGNAAFVKASTHNKAKDRTNVKKSYYALCDEFQRGFPENEVAQNYLKTKLLPKA